MQLLFSSLSCPKHSCHKALLSRNAPLQSRISARRCVSVQAAATLTIPRQFTKVAPKGDLVLVEVANAETASTGGVLLPTAAQKKPTSGDVVALGDGRMGTQVRKFTLKEGDTVLYNKFGLGATDVEVNGKDFTLLREDDLIGIMPRSNATAADVPKLEPLADRVLIKVEETADVSSGGVFLPESAKERPMAGSVVRTGPGRMEEDGVTRKAPCVAAGDRVLYFKYAGDNMETPDGTKYVVVHEQDILCKT